MEEAKVTSNATALIPNADAFEGQMPDLSKAQPAPLEISSEYWSPKEKGEKRRMFFMELRSEKSIDEQSGQDIDLLVAYFVEPLQPREFADGRKRVVRQASRRLTAVFENFQKTIRPGMAFEITYLGKERNATNSFMSDRWAIVPLKVEQQ